MEQFLYCPENIFWFVAEEFCFGYCSGSLDFFLPISAMVLR